MNIIITILVCIFLYILIYQNQTIIYKQPTELNLQFSPDNFPSKIYNDVFTGQNVWLGGFNMNTSSRIAQGLSA